MTVATGERVVERARAALSAGRTARALRLAWSATHRAVRLEDRETVAAVLRLAEEARDGASDRARALAEQLAVYCRACLDAPDGRLGTPSAFARLIDRDRPGPAAGPAPQGGPPGGGR